MSNTRQVSKSLSKNSTSAADKKRRSFLRAFREYWASLTASISREFSHTVRKSFELGWSIEATPKWHALSPIVERLEDRVLLATNIGVVRPDVAHANDLLAFYLDTQSLTGPRDDNSEIQYHFGLSNTSVGSSGANDLAIAGDWGNLAYDQGGVARNNVGAGAKQFFLDTDRDSDAEYAFRFGLPGDGVVAGNFDGSYGDDVGVTRNDNGFKHWYMAFASSDTTESFPRNDTTVGVNANFVFGFDSDFARVGDFNGDGIDDAVLIRNVGGDLTWYISHGPFPNNGSTLTVHQTIVYGINGYIPVVGDWNNNGDDNMGVIVNNNGAAEWYLDTNDAGPYEIFLSYGTFSDQFVVGQWPDRTWDRGAGTDNWADAANWSDNTLPGVTSKIVIDQPGSSTNVFHNSGTSNIGSIFSNEPISITGGALIVNQTSDAAAVGVNGGELELRAPLGANAFSMSSGVLFLAASNPLGGLGLQLSGGTVTVASGSQSLSNDINISNTVSFGGSGALALHGIIVGSGSFQKTGSNFVQVLGANTYSGNTIIAAGELLLGGSNRLPDTPVSIAAGAYLNLSGNNETVGALSGSGTVLLGSGAATFRTTSSTNSTFSGVISGNGVFNKAGSGSLTLANANTYVGDTHVEGGQMIVGAANAMPDSTTLDVQSGATFNVNGFNERVAAIGGSGVIELGTGQLKTNNSLSSSFFGSINGAGTVVKDGTASLDLFGASTFTGGLSIQGGTLRLQNSNVLSNTLPIAVLAGAILDLNNKSEAIGSLSGAGSVTLGSGTLSVGGDNTVTTFSGAISGSGGLSKTGTGGFTLSGTNSYSGPTTIGGAASLVLGSAGALPSGTAATIGLGSTLETNGFAVNLGSLTGSGNIMMGTGSITIGGNNATTTYSGGISGSGGLTKTGTGELRLDGIITFTGATNVNAGTLTINGPASTSSIAVGSGTKLKGSGTVGTTNVSGTIAPGSSPGILNTGNLSFATGSTFEAEIGGATPGGFSTSHDQIVVTGTVNISTSATFSPSSFNGFVPVLGNSFVLISNDGTDAITGNFAGLGEGVVIPNFLGASVYAVVSYVGGDGNDFTVTVTNQSPVLSAIESTAVSYTENASATAITSSLVISDVDNANMASATVSITSGFATGQDVLAATATGNITVSYDSATGILTLSGSDTKANYQAVLRSVTYFNSSDDPSTATRTISFQVNDGSIGSNVATRNITLTAANDAPVLSGIEGTAVSYTENASATAITSSLVVSDVDNANMVSATVSITSGFATGQDVLAATATGNITVSYDSATGILTLSGSDTKANYQAVLRSVTYFNSSDDPSTTTRTISFQVNDGSIGSNVATRNITLTAANDAPVLSGIEGTAVSYTENASATAITSSLVVSDVDNANMVSATVSITSGFATGQDVLAATATGNITVSYDSATGVLTLSGSDTKANYQSVLRSVTYFNSNENPSATTRTISFQVNDGTASSNVATRDVSVIAVDDAAFVVVSSGQVNVSDPDGDTASNLAVSIVGGKLRFASNTVSTVGAGAGTIVIDSRTVETTASASSLTAAIFALGNLNDQLSVTNNVSVPLQAVETSDLENVTVFAGATLTAKGILKAAIDGQSGSTVSTNGTAELGDGSAAGFVSVGSLVVNNSHTLTLRDSTGIVFPANTNVLAGGILFVIDNNGVHQASTVPAGSTILGTGAVNVSTILDGGTISSDPSLFFNSSITVTSGNLSPGTVSTPGQIWMNNLNLNGGTLEIGIAGSAGMAVTGGNDVLRVDNGVVDGQQGHVHLSGTDLSIVPIGAPSILAGNRYVIINNYGTDAIGGTLGRFASYAEGAVYSTNFLGSGLTARVTYRGGDGNDVAVVVDGAANIAAPSTDSNADTTTIVLNGGNLEFRREGSTIESRPAVGVTSIVLNGSGDDDTFILDFANGSPLPAGGIVINGNGQSLSGSGDALELKQGTATLITHIMTNANDGSISVDGLAVSYTGLEPIIDNLSATDRVFTFSGSDDSITLTTGTTLHNIIDSNFSESVEFNNPTNSLTINGGSGSDSVTITSIHSGFGASLTINGGTGDDTINLNADINFSSNNFLDVDLQNDDASPGADAIAIGTNANLILAGTGAAALKASKSIALASGSSIVTVNGNLTLEANQQTSATSGDFSGVKIDNGVVQASGSGVVDIRGRGGDAAAGSQYGILVIGGGDILGGTANTTYLNGIGGASAGDGNLGVLVSGVGSTLLTSGSNVSITGLGGGTSTTSFNYGVGVSGAALVNPGSMGNLEVVGTGGIGRRDYGVSIQGTNTLVTTSGGNISISGTGGSGTSGQEKYGVFVAGDGSLRSGGAGTVSVQGQGGPNQGSSNVGVLVFQGGNISSNNGDVIVNGTAGGSGIFLTGVWIQDAGVISAGGIGNVSVSGTGKLGAGTSISSGVYLGTNNARITSSSGNVSVIGIAGGNATSGSNHGVSVNANSYISAGGTGTVTVVGTGASTSGGSNQGVFVSGTSSSITSNGGAVSITGRTNAASSSGIEVSSSGVINDGGSGSLTLVANNLLIDATASINGTTNGTINLKQETNGLPIDVGGSDVLNTTLGLTDAELDRISAGTLSIGDSNSGPISISQAISYANNLALTTGGGATFLQSVNMSADKNLTVTSTSTTAGVSLSNSNADIIASGSGSVSLTSARNVSVANGASITTVNGNISLSANQQTTPTAGSFIGVDIIGRGRSDQQWFRNCAR